MLNPHNDLSLKYEQKSFRIEFFFFLCHHCSFTKILHLSVTSLSFHFILQYTAVAVPYRWERGSLEHRTQCSVCITILCRPAGLPGVCLCSGSVWLASHSSEHLQPLCSSGHIRFHTIFSPLHHYVVPVFPTLLISLEIGGTHAFVIVEDIQTLLGVITLFNAGVNVLVPNFTCILIHLNLL